MRILTILWGFPYVSETFILRQITGLIDLGHRVEIVAEHRPPAGTPIHADVQRHDLVTRTTYLELPSAVEKQRTCRPEADSSGVRRLRSVLSSSQWLVAAVPSLVRALIRAPELLATVMDQARYGEEAANSTALHRLGSLCKLAGPYDVLHAHYGPTGMSYRFARELFKAPLVVSFHGYDMSAAPYSEPGVYRGLFREVDAVIANSACARDRLAALGCPPSQVHVVRYGIALEEFSWPSRPARTSDPFRLLTVARLVEKKGLEFAIRAVARAHESDPNLAYDVIGEGPQRAQLERLIRDLGMQDVVTLHGQRDQAYVRRFLKHADLFILASVTAADGDQEGTPVALIEAQASGLPVIASAHSGIPEIVVDGTTGFLVAERDVDRIAERIRFLIGHPDIRASLGEAGRRYVKERFDQRRAMAALVRVYEDARAAYVARETRG